MFCRQCGKEFDENVFDKCPYCSARTGKGKRYCPKCGIQNKKAENICNNCGFNFTEEVKQPTNLKEKAEIAQKNNENKKEGYGDDFDVKKNDVSHIPIPKTIKPIETKSESQHNPVYVQKKTPETKPINTGKNSIADKILKSNEGKNNPFASYGKKPVSSPLVVPKQVIQEKNNNNENKQNDAENKKIEEENVVNISSKNPFGEVKNKVDTKVNNKADDNKDNFANKDDNNGVIKYHESNLNKSETNSNKTNLNQFSVLSVLTIIFALATLTSMQLFYCCAMVISAIIEAIVNKNFKMIIISSVVIVLALITLYFGVSFYVI